MPLPNVIVFVLCSFLLGGLGGFFLGHMSGERQIASNTPQRVDNHQAIPNQPLNNQINGEPSASTLNIQPIPEKKQGIALNNFDKTCEAIKKIVTEIESKQKKLPNSKKKPDIIKALQDALGNPNLNYSVIEGKEAISDEAHKFEWIDTIYTYQLNNNLQNADKAEGYILPQGTVINNLRKDVETRLKKETVAPSIPATGK